MLRYKNIYMEKANLTLYTVIGKPERIPEAIQKFFAAVAKEAVVAEGQTVLTLQDDTEITFNISHRRDRQEFIASHTEGMANYFLQAETGNEELKTNVIRQIQCFNCVTGIVFEIDENEERTNYIINTLFDLAAEINGFLLYPNMSLLRKEATGIFHTGRKRTGKLRPGCKRRPAGRRTSGRHGSRPCPAGTLDSPVESRRHSLPSPPA